MTRRPKPEADPGAFITALAAGMIELHEMFRAAVGAGFIEEQAMKIVLEAIRGATANGPP